MAKTSNVKKGKLSKVETSYIDNNPHVHVEALAKDLGRSVSVVEKYISANTNAVEEYVPPGEAVMRNEPVSKPEPPKTEITDVVKKDEKYKLSQVEGLFARREGITIMTPAAAEACDEHRDKCFSGKSKFSSATTTIK